MHRKGSCSETKWRQRETSTALCRWDRRTSERERHLNSRDLLVRRENWGCLEGILETRAGPNKKVRLNSWLTATAHTVCNPRYFTALELAVSASLVEWGEGNRGTRDVSLGRSPATWWVTAKCFSIPLGGGWWLLLLAGEPPPPRSLVFHWDSRGMREYHKLNQRATF